MNKKKIWIVNFHTAPPEYALNQRYIKIVPYLQKKNYDVIIISSAYLRRHQKDLSDGNNYNFVIYDGIPFIHIRSNKYKGNGLGRMLSLFIFSLKLILISKKFGRPDILYHNLHVPFDIPVYFAAKRFKAVYISEVWDLWPEFFHRSGLANKNSYLMRIAYWLEKWIYSKSEKIVFTLEGGSDYIRNKSWDTLNGGKINLEKVHYINNGIDIEQFEKDSLSIITNDKDLIDDTFRVTYVGSMNKANDLTQLIKAAEILKNETKLTFLLYGNGSERDRLERYCKSQNLDNIHFKETYLPFNHLPYILKKSSLNILNYQKNFGDFGISAGKLFLYLAAGKPVLSNVSVKYCLIKKFNLGISQDISDPTQYAKAILEIKNLNVIEYGVMCQRVSETSLQFDYKLLANKLLSVLIDVSK